MGARWIAIAGVLVASLAVADRKSPQDELGALLASYQSGGSGDERPVIAFSDWSVHIGTWAQSYVGHSFGEHSEMVGKPTVAYATGDPSIAWVAVDSHELSACLDAKEFHGSGDAFPCGDDRSRIVERKYQTYLVGATHHTTGLFVKSKKGWAPFAYHIGYPISAEVQATVKKPKIAPITREVGGADAIVATFEKSIATSKALAATVSNRADVVLYGSELAERYVGGDVVRKQLERWNLTFKVTGLHAGVASKTVGFVAANVEATAGKGKPAPYRVLAIYEKTDTWKLVQLHFSFQVPTGAE
jgi:hypothetical protein